MSESIEIGVDTLKVEGDATKLYDALAKAQTGFFPVAKVAEGQVGTSRKFKYADYTSLMKCVRPALAENGIIILQPLHSREDYAVTTTIIAGHGASITSSFSFKPNKQDPQEFGRHHTYYRRYQLQAMLGLAGDDDADDPPMPGVQYQEQAPPKEVKASAEKKPAAAKPSTNGSPATSSAPPTSSSQPTPAPTKTSEPAQPPLVSSGATNGTGDTRNINEKLLDGMKQKNWKMADIKAFFKEHVDPNGIDKVDNLNAAQKQQLWETMIKVAGVIPF